jgi:hypothetical protein
MANSTSRLGPSSQTDRPPLIDIVLRAGHVYWLHGGGQKVHSDLGRARRSTQQALLIAPGISYSPLAATAGEPTEATKGPELGLTQRGPAAPHTLLAAAGDPASWVGWARQLQRVG